MVLLRARRGSQDQWWDIWISISKCIITFRLFSVFFQKSHAVEDIESQVSTWKIVATMQRWSKNARIDYCTFFFLQKGASLALAAALCNDMVGCITNMRLSALKYFQYHSGQKRLKHSNKVYCLVKPNKCITAIDFRFASVILINLEHLSHPTLVLLFKFWEDNYCWNCVVNFLPK